MFPWTSALVTGASAGIGEAIAEQLASAGIHTVVVARRTDRLRRLADRYPNVEVLTADLLRPDGCASVVARLTDPSKPVELLVNNAGFGIPGTVATASPSGLVGMIDLNVRALTELTSAVVPSMVAKGRGWILQVSSVASFQPGPGAAVYSATKAYVTSFTEALFEELRGTGVHVTALCPGYTHTEFHAVANMSTTEINRVPKFAWLQADAVARSGLAAVAAGRALDVPGGLYKGISSASRVMPRRLVRRIAGRIGRQD